MHNCESCIHLNVCVDKFSSATSNSCADYLSKNNILYVPFFLGDTCYVVTKYSYSSPYEVIKCTVQKTFLKDDKTFSIVCQGAYAKNRFYRGAFNSKSLGKTIFITQVDAERKCEQLNAKRV